jgi:hypothetical protein
MERGCVGDQPQNATPSHNRCSLPGRTLLRLVSDTAALRLLITNY